MKIGSKIVLSSLIICSEMCFLEYKEYIIAFLTKIKYKCVILN